MGYKAYSDSYLMSLTKAEIIELLRVAEHNFFATEEALNNSAKAGMEIVEKYDRTNNMADTIHQLEKELKDLREFNDKIYDVLAKQFGSPCNLGYRVDEYMRKNGNCYDCSVEISDKECWSRYIQTKLLNDEK